MAEWLKLASGHSIPQFGLGTWLSKPGEVGAAVQFALHHGYRHVDCAQAYGNQAEIGEVFERVFKEGEVKREEVFITSKVWNTFHSFPRAKAAVDSILADLRLDYLDLLLIHWPMGFEEGGELFPKTGDKMRYSTEDYIDTWRALEEAVDAGKVRSIGVSNFNEKQIERIIKEGRIAPSVVQVELHPYFQQRPLRQFAKEKGLVVTAYSPLGNPSMPFRKEGDPSILTESRILQIAEHHKKTPAQVTLRWALQKGIVVIPKSTSEKRLLENADIFDFSLSTDEETAIDELDRGRRFLDLKFRDGDHPHFPW